MISRDNANHCGDILPVLETFKLDVDMNNHDRKISICITFNHVNNLILQYWCRKIFKGINGTKMNMF